MKLFITSDYLEMSRKVANIISAQIIIKPDTVLGLATGTTPIGAYNKLVEWNQKGDLDFSAVKTVNLDEYCDMPADHPQSYRYFMNMQLFRKVNILPGNSFLPDGMAKDKEAECRRYDKLIEDFGGIDLQLLGLGHNGHVGFNEPDETFHKNTHVVKLTEKTILANSRLFANVEDVPKYAMTMGINSIMRARKVLLAVSGADKAEILKNALTGLITPLVPASILQFHTDVTVVA
ncbi:MAG: glucosamine-6-phosphate deaminase, partial [Saccharofermentanales bacterium]